MKRIRLPQPDWYSVQELARLWGIDPDQLEMYGLQGLSIESTQGPGGREIRRVARIDAERFLNEAGASPEEKRINPSERDSLQFLLALCIRIWFADDGHFAERHYRIRGQLAADAAAMGFEMFRDKATDAKLIQESLRQFDRYQSRNAPQTVATPITDLNGGAKAA